MANKRKENFAIFVILAILDVIVFLNIRMIPSGGKLGVGADFMPKIVCVLLAICAMGFLIQGLRSPKAEKSEKPAGEIQKSSMIRFAVAMGLLLAYALLLQPVGFIIMTVVYIFFQSLLMVPDEKRSYKTSAILAVVSAVVIYFIFSKGLSMQLPKGILGNLF